MHDVALLAFRNETEKLPTPGIKVVLDALKLTQGEQSQDTSALPKDFIEFYQNNKASGFLVSALSNLTSQSHDDIAIYSEDIIIHTSLLRKLVTAHKTTKVEIPKTSMHNLYDNIHYLEGHLLGTHGEMHTIIPALLGSVEFVDHHPTD